MDGRALCRKVWPKVAYFSKKLIFEDVCRQILLIVVERSREGEHPLEKNLKPRSQSIKVNGEVSLNYFLFFLHFFLFLTHDIEYVLMQIQRY